jgi:putative acetyltransferase
MSSARQTVIIRREEPGDAAAIRQVNERAFGQPAEANLVDALRRHNKVVLSLVAVLNDQIIGHILFSPVSIESEGGSLSAVGLAPMAVLPEYQKQGIGSWLIRVGLDECRQAGHPVVIVVGHAEYYPRFGFVPASKYGLKCEYNVPDDVFLALELREGALLGRAGVVKYQPEFNEV